MHKSHMYQCKAAAGQGDKPHVDFYGFVMKGLHCVPGGAVHEQCMENLKNSVGAHPELAEEYAAIMRFMGSPRDRTFLRTQVVNCITKIRGKTDIVEANRNLSGHPGEDGTSEIRNFTNDGEVFL